MKEVIWMGSSKADLKAFPATVMDNVGHQTSQRDIKLARKRLQDILR
jgi:phage-related protein